MKHVGESFNTEWGNLTPKGETVTLDRLYHRGRQCNTQCGKAFTQDSSNHRNYYIEVGAPVSKLKCCNLTAEKFCFQKEETNQAILHIEFCISH